MKVERARANKPAPFKSVNKTLLVYILLASTCITTISTAFSFYIDFTNEKEIQNQTLEQVKSSSLKSLTEAVWNVDQAQIESNLQGLLDVHDIIALKILDEKGKEAFSKEKAVEGSARDYVLVKKFPLVYERNSKSINLGTFIVSVSNYYLYQRLTRKVLFFFVSQGVKTLIISFIMLSIFGFFVTRHLNAMASHFVGSTLGDDSELQEIQLSRKLSYRDEFDILADSYNRLVQKVNTQYEAQQDEIVRKENLVEHSARMASIGEMASNVGHEINNPLTIIAGYSRRLGRVAEKMIPQGEMEEFHKVQESMDSSINRIGKIVTGLRNLSRDSTDEETSETSLGTLMHDVEALIGEKFKSMNIRFEIKYKNVSPDLMLKIKRVQVGQVLINLLNNSTYAIESQENPWVHIEIETTDEHLQISVNDSGLGIPDHIRDKIFEPFFSTKPVGAGTGIGLSISKRIMTDHLGTIGINEASHNTSIVLRFPLEIALAA